MCRRRRYRLCNSKFPKWRRGVRVSETWRIISHAGSARGRVREERKEISREHTALHFRDYTKPGDPGVTRISRVP